MEGNGRSNTNLALATLGFGLCFAVWSLVSPLAVRFQQMFGLTDFQTGVLIAVPVLLGAVARIPMGMLTDRYGGRVVFTGLIAFSIVPVVFLGFATSYWMLLFGGFFLGMAGSSFAIGIPFVSRWYSAGRQGTALGIYGAGNIGTALAAYSAPWIAVNFGWQYAFWVFAPLLAIGATAFWLLARDAPGAPPPRSISESLQVIQRERLSWAFSFFYFVTFGGFVAFSIFLPKLLVDWFALETVDAGLRAAGFVVVATAARPVGGYLADRMSGGRVLTGVFGVVPLLALVLAHQAAVGPGMIPVTIAALSTALMLGLGNGAVFKLVPQHFPRNTGVVTGVVGAAGGLGGFFPPIVMGLVRDVTGSYALGLVLLAITAAACLALVLLVLRDQAVPAGERGEGVRAGRGRSAA
jgi:MFS transporter, NNP family, nitrate/nitrite transporter